jgi:hypothetical protein
MFAAQNVIPVILSEPICAAYLAAQRSEESSGFVHMARRKPIPAL